MLRTSPSHAFRDALLTRDLRLGEARTRAFEFREGSRDRRRGVVCLAGMGADGRSFVRLAPLAPDWFVLPLNTPVDTPHGRSPLEFAADTVEEFLEEESLEDPVLVGSSFGGAVATLVALRRRERLGGLVLVSAVLSRRQIPLASPSFINLIEAPDPLARLFAPAAVQVMGGLSLDPDARDEIVRQARRYSTRELKNRLLSLMSLDLFPRLSALAGLPTLWVHGTRDWLVPWRRGRAGARQIPGAVFSLVKGAGHLPYLSHWRSFNGVLRRFLDEVEAKHEGPLTRAGSGPSGTVDGR